jgi:hypothetical protein
MDWKWREREPSLDELLEDEVMQRVVRRTGSNPAEFRRRLAELARRLPLPRVGNEYCHAI